MRSLLRLHLQGESIDAIVQQTGHAHTTVQRWVRRFAVDGLLLDRPRSGRPLSVMTPTVVASQLSRRNVIGDAVCLLVRRHLCVILPNRRNDVIWTDDPSTIEPIVRVAHSVSINAFGAFSASGKSPLFFFF